MAQDSAAGARGGAALDTEGNSPTPPPADASGGKEKRRTRRAEMDELKRVNRSVTTLRAVSLCMLASSAVAISVGRSMIAHVGGVHRCGSPWSCPLCAPVVRRFRAGEVDDMLAEAFSRGWSALLVTSTVPHKRLDALAERLACMAMVGGQVRSGAPWVKRRRDQLGFRGAISALDLTLSNRNGWHPHNHSIWLFDRELTAAEIADFRAWHFGRLVSICERKGFGTPDPRAFDVRVVGSTDVAGYVAKFDGAWSAGAELARSDLKRGADRLTPFDLLTWLVKTGEVKPLRLWHEYEQATAGKRSVRFSPGLRAELLGTENEATDVEVAAVEDLDLTLLRVLVEASDWNRIVGQGRRAEFLDGVEDVAGFQLLVADLQGPARAGLRLHGLWLCARFGKTRRVQRGARPRRAQCGGGDAHRVRRQ